MAERNCKLLVGLPGTAYEYVGSTNMLNEKDIDNHFRKFAKRCQRMLTIIPVCPHTGIQFCAVLRIIPAIAGISGQVGMWLVCPRCTDTSEYHHARILTSINVGGN